MVSVCVLYPPENAKWCRYGYCTLQKMPSGVGMGTVPSRKCKVVSVCVLYPPENAKWCRYGYCTLQKIQGGVGMCTVPSKIANRRLYL